MCETATPRDTNPRQYEIRLLGHLDARWAKWFEGLTITLEADGVTLLSGPVVDQAALHGLLRNIRDTGMVLLSVNCVPPRSSPISNLESRIDETWKKGNTQ